MKQIKGLKSNVFFFQFSIKTVFISIGLLLHFNNSWAQDHSQDKWVFGDHAMVDFSSGNPISGSTNSMLSSEACAAVCDKTTGQLLFYTNAVDVWDKTHTLKTTSTKLNGQVNTLALGHSAQQGCLIVPMQGNPNRYYIFTVSDAHNNGNYHNNGLCYTIVDVNATTIVLSNFNTPVPSVGLSSWTTPQLTAIPNCDGSYWVITHGITSTPGITNTDLRAYLFTSTGIAAPVVTAGFPVTRTNTVDVDPVSNGWMAKASPDGNKVAFTVHNYVTAADSLLDDSTFIYDFNRGTGVFSNKKSFYGGSYGMAFSPNSQLLYTLNYNPAGHNDMRQYQISNGSFLTMNVGFTTGPKLATNGKIYLLAANSTMLDVIDHPNTIGTFSGIGYTANGLILESPMVAGYVLPNSIEASAAVGVKVPVQNVCLNADDMKIGIHHPSYPSFTFSSYLFSPAPGQMFSSSPGFYTIGSNAAWFSPASAGVGAHTINYTYADPSFGCTTTASCIINVVDTPHVNFPSIPDIDLCSYNGSQISIPIISNGNTCTLSGPGTDPVHQTFDPVLAGGAGTYTLTYTCSNAFGCTSTVQQTVNVTNNDQWQQTTQGSSGGDKYNDVTTDLAGNVYSVGSFMQSTNLDLVPLLPISNNTNFETTLLTKYDRCGNVIWSAHVSNSETNVGQSIVLDESRGLLYIAGDYSSAATFNSAGSCGSPFTQSINGPAFGAYVAQYDMVSGCLYFAQDATIPGNAVTDPQSMTINENNGINIYIAGKCGVNTFAPGVAYIKKYTPTFGIVGGNLGTGWTIISTNLSNASIANDIDFDELNNRVWVIGTFSGTISFNVNPSPKTTVSSTDAFLVSYKELGVPNPLINPVLHKIFKGNAPSASTSMTGEGLAINSANGNPCLTGSYKGIISVPFELNPPWSINTLTNSPTTANAYMICTDFTSQTAWARMVEANPGIATGYSVDINNSKAYFTGSFNKSIIISGVIPPMYSYSGTGFRIYTAAYNVGVPATGWADVTNSPSNGTHLPNSITTDNANHLFVVGSYNGEMGYLNPAGGSPTSGNLFSMGVGNNAFVLRGSTLDGDFKMLLTDNPETEMVSEIALPRDFSFSIKAVPNPTTGIVDIWTEGLPDNEPAMMEVLNLTGTSVYNIMLTSKKYTADLSMLPAGTYLLRITFNNYPVTIRIIKI